MTPDKKRLLFVLTQSLSFVLDEQYYGAEQYINEARELLDNLQRVNPE